LGIFPAAREVLHEAKAFNDKNSAMPVSFDQILNSRRFNAVIYKEENVYGDRTIEEYMKIMLKINFRVRKSQRKKFVISKICGIINFNFIIIKNSHRIGVLFKVFSL
jgi:hypothetical protein